MRKKEPGASALSGTDKAANFSADETLSQNNFRQIYEMLTREEKRTLWRSAFNGQACYSTILQA